VMAESRLINAIGAFTGAVAGLVAVVYFTGGAVLSLRLGLERLPSTAAVPYLPREFLVSLGLNVVLPAIAAGALTALVLRWRGRALRSTAPAGVAVGVAVYVLVGGLLVAKSPFPATACLTGGGEAAGVFIGETDARTYLGDLSSRRPRRIVSIPVDRVERLLVGGSEAAIVRLRCP
jgi:hypothetical protein